MQFDQQFNEGDFRICVAAAEIGRGRGYTAAVVVSRVRGAVNTPCEVYRDTCLAGGHRWLSRSAALSYAMSVGREIAHTEPSRLALQYWGAGETVLSKRSGKDAPAKKKRMVQAPSAEEAAVSLGGGRR